MWIAEIISWAILESFHKWLGDLAVIFSPVLVLQPAVIEEYQDCVKGITICNIQ